MVDKMPEGVALSEDMVDNLLMVNGYRLLKSCVHINSILTEITRPH